MGSGMVEVLSDLSEACEVLAEAFFEDRAVRNILRMDHRQLRRLYDFWVPTLLGDPHSIVFGVREDRRLVSVAVCQGPGAQGSSLWMAMRGLPLVFRMGLRRSRLLLRMDRDFRRESPLRPGHLRLAVLGTRPEAFRRGHGSALLRRVDEHAAFRGLRHVYLEADSEGQPKRLYQRHGYQTVKRFESMAGPIDIMVKQL